MSASLFSWLADLKCNSLSLCRDDDHACNYMSAGEWIASHPDEFQEVEQSELQHMVATNTIWSLQIYPHTPVGFYKWYGDSMESVLRQAKATFEEEMGE